MQDTGVTAMRIEQEKESGNFSEQICIFDRTELSRYFSSLGL